MSQAQATGEITPLETLRVRLRQANRDVSAKRQAYEDAVALRDELVVEAIDTHRLSYAEAGRIAALSPARVVQIMAKGR